MTSLRSLMAVAAGSAGLAVTSAPALAAEGGGAGLPQLDPSNFATQIFWLAVTFIALYLLMSRVALPRVRDVLEERERRITDDLEKAQRLKDESEAVLAEYEKALADARASAQALFAQAAEQANAEAAKRQQDVAQKLAKQLEKAESRVQAAKTEALDNIRQVATEVAQDAAARLIGGDVAEDDAAKAVSVAMKDAG
ncbi:F0F1 ATP synthase subunit B family protein [Oceanibaculum nanhaiense]|jgi:F-type H+-transporting ATPase subunit b|uniref:F0F1 ATP synthase subunit B family protein n=2 Tax=Oceanibaculum nanhaiense TaxID=1909734 RepID=UPI001FE262CE|nr:F0F1 ATP synthase subunit B' [Oceanibaculum nanhaiense]